MTRLQAYRVKRLHKEADALLARARKYHHPHVQSEFQIGYVPPLQTVTRAAKPRGRYWLMLLCVVLTIVYINKSPAQAHDVCHVVSEK